MGKRSDFKRVARDFYPTPYEAVVPLLPHLAPRTKFVEPCAGDFRLAEHLTQNGHICRLAYDIEPQSDFVIKADALWFDWRKDVFTTDYFDCFITNPPWDRKILHPLITHLSDQNPTWLLFDADWMHTKQSAQFLPRLRNVVSVGRVKWIPDSKMTGKDNACWYLFDKPAVLNTTYFYGRT